MKPTVLALLACAVITLSITTTSCHKKKSASTASTGNPLISGLTAVKFRIRYDSSIVYANPYIKWNFTGTNPITATPDTLANHVGYQQLSFSGSQPTQLAYVDTGFNFTNYMGLTANISYTPAGLIDTITFQYAITVLGAEKAVFQYNGSQIAKITVALSTNIGSTDSFIWASPDVYTFTYTGNNISQIDYVSPLNSYSTTVTYVPDTRKNNLAGSMTTFLQLEFLENTTSVGQMWLDLPKYMNADLLLQTNVQNITDAEGRLTQTITYTGGASHYDTVFYYY